MIKSKKQMFIVISVFTLVMLLGIVSYAFFNYTRTGSANTIKLGRISFISRQTETISLTNLFPIDPTETGIMNDSTKVGTLEIEIEGDTDYSEGVEYLISTVDSNIYSGGKTIPISINVTVEDLGTSSDSYFTARNSKNANIYKRLSGDVISGDQMLLVGYIKPNTTSGTTEGIDGSITIKAYLDQNRIAITDTYSPNGVSDNNGTTEEWVDDRVVLTTNEWNVLQSSGISFKVKVEANEGIWVDEPIYNMLRMNAVMDNIQSTNVSATTGIDFSKISGDTDSDGVIDNGEGLYIRSGTETDAYPVVYYRGAVEDNNVYFAGKCWQIIRTSETGGTKMIYNGENTGTEEEPACEPATGEDRQITLNINNTDTNIFKFSVNNSNSLAYNGYMYKSPVYSVSYGDYSSGSKFGNGVIYDGTNYTITDVSDTLDANHHYTCGTTNTITCSTIRYYFSYYNTVRAYFALSAGKKIDDVINESFENGTDESNVKVMIEQWYASNIENTNYKSMIEDTIYCNDRSYYQLGGLNPNGGELAYVVSSAFFYSGRYRNDLMYSPNTKCARVQDSFTKSSSNGNGLLNYPIGMITVDEIALAGGRSRLNNLNYYLRTGSQYMSMSPYYFFDRGSASNFVVAETGDIGGYFVDLYSSLRPVISLKQDSSILSGTGTGADPFIIK